MTTTTLRAAVYAKLREFPREPQAPRQPKPQSNELTDDDKRLLELLIEGSTQRRIAAEFDCGLRTVERRTQQIRRKLGAPTIVAAAAKYARLQS
jgi:DNA-binding NarL/FixJ family response regulator